MKKLLLVFTDKTDCENGAQVILKADFWNGQLDFPYFLNANGKCDFENAEIIFVPDHRDFNLYLIGKTFATIEHLVGLNNIELNVIFHKRANQISETTFRNTSFKGIPKKLAELNFIEQSHISGSVFCDELKEIEIAIIGSNNTEFKRQLQRIYDRFPDPIKEAKLNLLLHCESPAGARLVKAAFENDERKFADALKDEKVNSILVKELIEMLSALKDEVDCENPEYLRKLKDLRVSLLGS